MQQFAGRVYGPLIAHGIALVARRGGNYWGHNAIIRTRAFAEQAGLPELPGRTPFGGPIISHDFVEAALMRRGGWAVHMVAGAARQLRGGAADADRPRGARPPLVPGQPAALRGAAGARLALRSAGCTC